MLTNQRVLISGAGMSGLMLAYWLKRYGFAPTIVERHPTLRTGGYKIDIRGVALEVIMRTGVYDAIFEAKTDSLGTTIVDDKGQRLRDLSANLCGARVDGDLEIIRGDLCEILFKQLGDAEYLFGDSIQKIIQTDEGVHVTFEKNGARTFDLVIGADGLHSAVRRLVFGKESDFLKELGLYVSVFTMPNFLGLERQEIEHFWPQRWVNLYSLHGNREMQVSLAFASRSFAFDPRNKEEQQKRLKEAFAHMGWEMPRILAAMDDAPDFYFDVAAQVYMPKWSQGRVALIGDAGYAPSPITGQGTSVALVGAYVLANELAAARGDYEKAFIEYERVLRAFVKENQDAIESSIRLMNESSWIAWLIQKLVRLLPAHVIEFFKKRGMQSIHKAANSLDLKDYPIKDAL